MLDAYENALRRCAAEVERVAEDELAFRVSLRPPERLGLNHPDLGLVSKGTLVIVATEAGYRLDLEALPRTWFLALSIAPWLLLVWGLGLTTAPWRYLLAFGGLPLFVLMWVVVWANLHAFLDHTNRSLRTTAGVQLRVTT